jgi:hypothetical protein
VENTKGPTTAFATFSPYKSYLDLVGSFCSLGLAWTQTAGARELRFLHTAHFSVIPPWKLRRAGIRGRATRAGALLFISAYNGDPEKYFRGFSDHLASVLDTVWRWCVDWKGAHPYSKLAWHIERYQRPSPAFFNAYADTSPRMRASLVLRRQLDKLYAQALSPDSDAAFQASFNRISQNHWGDAPPTREDL